MNIAEDVIEELPREMMNAVTSSDKLTMYIDMQNKVDEFAMIPNNNRYQDAIDAINIFSNELRQSGNNSSNYAMYTLGRIYLTARMPLIRSIRMNLTNMMGVITEFMNLGADVFNRPPSIRGGLRRKTRYMRKRSNRKMTTRKRNKRSHKGGYTTPSQNNTVSSNGNNAMNVNMPPNGNNDEAYDVIYNMQGDFINLVDNPTINNFIDVIEIIDRCIRLLREGGNTIHNRELRNTALEIIENSLIQLHDMNLDDNMHVYLDILGNKADELHSLFTEQTGGRRHRRSRHRRSRHRRTHRKRRGITIHRRKRSSLKRTRSSRKRSNLK